jgi:hypothetical protein
MANALNTRPLQQNSSTRRCTRCLLWQGLVIPHLLLLVSISEAGDIS